MSATIVASRVLTIEASILLVRIFLFLLSHREVFTLSPGYKKNAALQTETFRRRLLRVPGFERESEIETPISSWTIYQVQSRMI